MLPGRDASGRRVIFSQALDGLRFSYTDMMRAHLITYEALLVDNDDQFSY